MLLLVALLALSVQLAELVLQLQRTLKMYAHQVPILLAVRRVVLHVLLAMNARTQIVILRTHVRLVITLLEVNSVAQHAQLVNIVPIPTAGHWHVMWDITALKLKRIVPYVLLVITAR